MLRSLVVSVRNDVDVENLNFTLFEEEFHASNLNLCRAPRVPVVKMSFPGVLNLFSSQESRWLSSSFREVVLGTLLPATIIVVTLVYDVLSSIRLPKPLRNILRALGTPFRDFLTLEDLEDPVDYNLSRSAWRERALVTLAISESAGWLGYFVYTVTLTDSVLSTEAVVACVAWVRFQVTCTRFLSSVE